MNKVFLIVMILLFSFGFSQEKEREILYGKVIADTMDVVNITVFNKSTNVGAVTDFDGLFSIKAKAKDTLVFRALSFESKHYVVTEADMLIDDFKVKLEIKINELNELVLTPNALTGIIEVDVNKINVFMPDLGGIDISKLGPDDIRNTKPSNPIENEGFSSLRGINFLAIFDLFVSKDRKEKNRLKRLRQYEDKKWNKEVLVQSFYTHLFKRYSYNFFVSNLEIKKEDITSFIAFAEPDIDKLSHLLKYENEMELIEYLLEKREAFYSNKKEENTTNKIDEQKE